MADRRHAVTQLDFFIRQVTLFADEIRNAVGQKLDVLGFKTTGRDLGEQMAFGFLLEFLQKVVVILCDRFACHRIQRLGKILLGETVCIRQALGQGLFHFIGKLPVRRMNLFASISRAAASTLFVLHGSLNTPRFRQILAGMHLLRRLRILLSERLCASSNAVSVKRLRTLSPSTARFGTRFSPIGRRYSRHLI